MANSSTLNNSNLSLDKRSLIQKMSSEIDHLEMDPSQFYFANDARNPQNVPLQPLFKQRQISQGVPMQGNIIRAPLSSSVSLDMQAKRSQDQIIPEKQYHFLPGDETDVNAFTLPTSSSRDGMDQLYPGPQPPPRNTMDRNNIIAPNPAVVQPHRLPFANTQQYVRDPLENRPHQTFSTFLEDKHYETLEKRNEQSDTGASSLVNFPPSNPMMTDVKNMKVDDNDTIVRQITVKKKKNKYPIKCLLCLFQIFMVVLVLAVAAVAVIALLEVKKLEDTPTPQSQVQFNALESMITNLTDKVATLNTQITSLNAQLTQTNATLDDRVVVVENEGTQLNTQFQTLNATVENKLGPCIHNRRICRANTGSSCVPDGNHESLRILEGYEVTAVWCEGNLANETLSLDILSRMSTYVVFFDLTPHAYECGCRLEDPFVTIFGCITNIVQCRV